MIILPHRLAIYARHLAAIATLTGLIVSTSLFSNSDVASAAAPSPTTPNTRYYANVDHSVSGAFLNFYDSYGGVNIFGYPISDVLIENNRPVQYFERQRFEYHQEAAGTPYEVQLTLLGKSAVPINMLSATPANTIGYNILLFKETQHSVASPFLDYWKANGDIRVFGYPVSEATYQNGLLVQYFERARMEYHPETAKVGYSVELGLLGKDYLNQHSDVARAAQTQAMSLEQAIAQTAPRVVLSSPGGQGGAQQVTGQRALSSAENDLMIRINGARKAAGLAPVTLDGRLATIALSRSQDMANNQYFSHTTPTGTNFMTMLKNSNIGFRTAGEIIHNNNYSQAESSLQAYNAFMNSPPHREIIMDPRFTLIGVGEATDSKGYHYFTVIFLQQ